MRIIEYVTLTGLFTTATTISGWWLKSRLEASIKHEYDQIIERLKSELKRSEVLHNERLAAFKEMSKLLISLRRYCLARHAEVGIDSEFASRTESLDSSDNISLLMHHERIHKMFEEKELFFSKEARGVFKELAGKMSLGFNLELYIASGTSERELNADKLYCMLADFIDEVLSAMYNDLGFESV